MAVAAAPAPTAPDIRAHDRAEDIAREIGNDDVLKRKSKIVAFIDLPGVPEGTKGLVALVGGWDKWIRYHVLFDNGVTLGSVNREFLAPVKRYDELRSRRRDVLDSGVLDEPEVDETAEAEATGGDGGGGEGATVNGVAIPAHLIERSKQARQRLGA